MINEQPLFSLEDADLSNLLMPSWVKESSVNNASLRVDQNQKDQESFSSPRARSGFHQDRREGRSRNISKGRDNKDRSAFSKREQYPPRVTAPAAPAFHGWKIEFLPEQRGLDEIAKQLKTEAKAYPLFELAKLILEKPERYLLRFVKTSLVKKTSSKLYQCRLDDSLWLSEKELIAHVLKNYRDRYYLTETIEVESPKGSYAVIAVCGMSETILGPSNHHEYQAKVRRLHTERFPNLPFEVFKSRIKMVRDEALVEQWKTEQTTRETFTPCDTPEGSEAGKILTLAEVEMHFKREHATGLIVEVEEEAFLSGVVGIRFLTSSIRNSVQQALEELRRFPLPLSHLLGNEFTARGLQVFKAHENIVYVSIARPRVLNHQETPLSPPLTALIKALEAHYKSLRAEQWKAMVASRPLSTVETEAERESAVAKDLAWLIHEGYVVNYALRGFALAKKPQPERAAHDEKNKDIR